MPSGTFVFCFPRHSGYFRIPVLLKTATLAIAEPLSSAAGLSKKPESRRYAHPHAGHTKGISVAEAPQAIARVRAGGTAVPPAGQTSQPAHKTKVEPVDPDSAAGRSRRLPWAHWPRGRWLLTLGFVVFGGVLGTYIADLANHISVMAAMRDLVVYNQGGLITPEV
jgi:hypothetical protein